MIKSIVQFPFEETPNTATIICCHVIEGTASITYVFHDEDDGMWQFLCDKQHCESEARLVSLYSVFEIDNTIGKLDQMPCGYYAERKDKNSEWVIRKA